LAQHDLSEDLYANVLNWESYEGFTDHERVALEYTTKFASDHLAIDQQLINRMVEHFGDETVFEITLCIGAWLALGRTMQVMGAEMSCRLIV
jgi:alkylhydroperoxidase family enzyme